MQIQKQDWDGYSSACLDDWFQGVQRDVWSPSFQVKSPL